MAAYVAQAGQGQDLFKTYLDAVDKSRKALAEWREETIRSKIASGALTPEEGAKQIAAIKSDNREESADLQTKKWTATSTASRDKYLAETGSARRTIREYEQQQGATEENQRTYDANAAEVADWRKKREAAAEQMKQTGPTTQMQNALALWDNKINEGVAALKEQQNALGEAKNILAANAPKADEARRTLAKVQADRPLQMASEDEELQAIQAGRMTGRTREANVASRAGLESKAQSLDEQIKADEQHRTQAKEGRAPEQLDALHAAASSQRAGGGQLASAIQRLAEVMDKEESHPTSLIHALTVKLEAEIREREKLKAQIQQLPTGGN
jgi:hypothetical protein